MSSDRQPLPSANQSQSQTSQAALTQWALLHAGVLSHTRLQPAALQLVTDLAKTFGCERASLGLLRGERVRLIAVSQGNAQPVRGSLGAELEGAMEEALEQDCMIALPESAGTAQRITFAHGPLYARGSGAVASLPLRSHGAALGAVTLEWRDVRALADMDFARLEHQLMLLSPLFSLLRHGERSLGERIAAGVNDAWKRSTWRRRVAVAVAAALLVGMLGWPAASHVEGTARVEGAVERAITAPADGFLKAVHVRPGDGVSEGQLLFELAEQDMRVDAQRLVGEVAQHDSATLAALAQSDRSQMAIHLARAEEAKAQLALVSSRIHRARVEAPFAGVVLDGDLGRTVGAPVKRGDVLLTITPFEGRRVVVQIDERDIARVRPGQAVSLVLSSMPWKTLSLTASKVRPVARAVEGVNVFEVEAVTTQADAALVPGMSGVARVGVGREPLALRWWRRASNVAMLSWWRWGF